MPEFLAVNKKEKVIYKMQTNQNYREAAFFTKFEEPVEKLLMIDEKLIVVCNNSIHEINDPSTEDPNYEYPFAPITNSKVLDYGAKNEIVTIYLSWIESLLEDSLNIKESSENNFPDFGLLLHSDEFSITCSYSVKYEAHFEKNRKEIAKNIWEILVSMTRFDDLLKNLVKKYTSEKKKISAEMIEKLKKERVCECPLRIVNLIEDVKNIVLLHWGQIFRSLINVLKLSSEMQFSKISKEEKRKISQGDKNFKNIYEILLKEPSNFKFDILKDFVSANEKQWLGRLVAMRNALEHPSKGKELIIKNFQISLGREIELPTIQLKHSRFSDEIKNLIQDLNSNSNLLHVFTINLIFLCTLINLKEVTCGTSLGDIYTFKEEFFNHQLARFKKKPNC